MLTARMLAPLLTVNVDVMVVDRFSITKIGLTWTDLKVTRAEETYMGISRPAYLLCPGATSPHETGQGGKLRHRILFLPPITLPAMTCR